MALTTWLTSRRSKLVMSQRLVLSLR